MGFSSDVLSIEKQNAVAIVWLDREEKYNAMSSAVWLAIPQALEEIVSDSDIGAVVIAGRGKHFCVGVDLAETAINPQKTAKANSQAKANLQQLEITSGFQKAISAVADCPLPVIGVIHGFCLGAGVDLITACDIRIASADAIFSVRETRIGLVADVGTLQRLPKILNAGHVAELAYTGKDIDAQRAEKIGLINDVYDTSELALQAGLAMANEIAANSPMAVRGTKFMLQQNENLTTEQSLMLNGMFTMMTSLQSNDLKEGIKAFTERRPPKFTGS
jgi:enoyl-CoA hydratase